MFCVDLQNKPPGKRHPHSTGEDPEDGGEQCQHARLSPNAMHSAQPSPSHCMATKQQQSILNTQMSLMNPSAFIHSFHTYWWSASYVLETAGPHGLTEFTVPWEEGGRPILIDPEGKSEDGWLPSSLRDKVQNPQRLNNGAGASGSTDRSSVRKMT